jgi:multimeric flavodoxin WrbA
VSRLLLVVHSRSGRTAELAEAVAEGIALGGPSVSLDHLDAFDAGPAEVLAADAVILGTPARFGYMSGAMKDFLERVYHPCLDVTAGKPWALFVKGDTDVAGATASVERIVAGLRWRRVRPPLEIVGPLQPVHREQAVELGGVMGASLESGLI